MAAAAAGASTVRERDRRTRREAVAQQHASQRREAPEAAKHANDNAVGV
jgi:hypothetical protein